MNAETVVIFGGAGFIGINFALILLKENISKKIILIDIKEIDDRFLFPDIKRAIEDGRISLIREDVRDRDLPEKIEIDLKIDLIANFAATHREPGHEHFEYYNTNILGAHNVCAFAEKTQCNTLLFTSSIAVYEPNEAMKTESTVPAPISAYGGSKLAAEYIHRTWQARDEKKRKLVIVRPGVVYGPAEGGNVTRMIKAIKHGIFVFVGNKQTKKASIYIKELVSIMVFLLDYKKPVVVANAVVPTPPSMKDYVDSIKQVIGSKKKVPTIPFNMLLFVSYIITGLMMGKKTSINPVRVKKLRVINNITSSVLPTLNYRFKYSLTDAFIDWYENNPIDW